MKSAMKETERLARKARQLGMTYGKYVATLPVKEIVKDNRVMRTCKTCGKMFEVRKIQTGQLSKQVNCDKCKNRRKKV